MIMKFKALEKYKRHTFESNGCKIMIDSGAEVAIWVSSVEKLLTIFPNAKYLQDYRTLISGFGGSGVMIKEVYEIPSLVLTDDAGQELRLNTLNVAIDRLPHISGDSEKYL